MKIKKIYLDSSVIGGCFDEEFKVYSNILFDYFEQEIYIPILSQITIDEISKAPDNVVQKLKSIEAKLLTIDLLPEMNELANLYIAEKIVPLKYANDALHIAIATVAKIDVLVSWNFKHIVNLDKIHRFNSVNMREGYNILEIRTPREVIYYDK